MRKEGWGMMLILRLDGGLFIWASRGMEGLRVRMVSCVT